MPEVLSKLQQRILEFWNNLDKSQKKRVYITSTILVVVIAVAIVMLTRTNYVPLMTITDPKSAQEIEKVLQEKNIKYKPSDGGKILVDAKDKNKAEFALASQGVTSTGMTFEDAWNLLKISSTESDKKYLWQNFKKNSLIEKLKMFENVKDADVDLALPETSNFVISNENEKATAYVKIEPKGTISPEQVEGIVRVVASSIEGLDPKNVTVVDHQFNILNSNSFDDAISVSTNQYKLKLKVKDELEKNVKMLYPGRTDAFDFMSVVVNPVLEFDKVKSQKQEVLKPTDIDEAPVSVEETKEKLENGGVNGAPGTDTNPGDGNVPGYPVEGGDGSTYDKSTNRINYDYNRIMTEEEKAIGTVKFSESSMTVALWYGDRVEDDTKMTPEFQEQLKNDVSNATGIPVSRISVSKYKVAPKEEIQEPIGDKIKQLIDEYGFFALMLLLVIGLMIAMIPKKKKKEEPQPELSADGPKFIVPEAEEELPEIDMEERSEVKKQIDKFVKQKPDAVAQLLRNWLSDEWD